MSDIELLGRVVLALGFGAILGLETETRSAKVTSPVNGAQRLGGVRTYTILSLFGALAGILFAMGYPVFGYLMFGGVFVIVLAAYILNVQYNKAFGMTTEMAILITSLIGFAATSQLISLQLLLVIVVILIFILSQKQGIQRLTKQIAHQELEDVVKFLIVAIVILPFLPNIDMRLADVPVLAEFVSNLGLTGPLATDTVIVNPFRLWQYVVLISGISLFGYFASRAIGVRKGLLVNGVFGGLVSSTATTIALATRSRKDASNRLSIHYAAAALVAHGVSFVQIMVLALSVSPKFFKAIVPASVVFMVVSVAAAIWLERNRPRKNASDPVPYEPYTIGPAIRFAVLLTVIRIVIQVADYYLGDNALVAITALSGLLGMDVATITLGELVTRTEVLVPLALLTYVLANGVNFGAKAAYSAVEGSSVYVRVVAIVLLISFMAGLAMAAWQF